MFKMLNTLVIFFFKKRLFLSWQRHCTFLRKLLSANYIKYVCMGKVSERGVVIKISSFSTHFLSDAHCFCDEFRVVAMTARVFLKDSFSFYLCKRSSIVLKTLACCWRKFFKTEILAYPI